MTFDTSSVLEIIDIYLKLDFFFTAIQPCGNDIHIFTMCRIHLKLNSTTFFLWKVRVDSTFDSTQMLIRYNLADLLYIKPLKLKAALIQALYKIMNYLWKFVDIFCSIYLFVGQSAAWAICMFQWLITSKRQVNSIFCPYAENTGHNRCHTYKMHLRFVSYGMCAFGCSATLR